MVTFHRINARPDIHTGPQRQNAHVKIFFDVIGQEDAHTTIGPIGHLGTYHTRDGSVGAPVGIDFD